jgi:putative oxidoreductase
MNRHDDAGKLVLRLVLGILILFHGVFKMTHGAGFIEPMLAAHHLPGFLAYLVYIGEVLAPILLIVGLYSRLAALIVVINMLFALALVHSGQIGMINGSGGYQLELQAMYLFTALAIVLFGAGRFSLGGSGGRYN